MGDRPTPETVRHVLERIIEVDRWLMYADYQPEEADIIQDGRIGECESDSSFRDGLVCALLWVAGEYGDNMPASISRLVQHTNRRDLYRLLKSYEKRQSGTKCHINRIETMEGQ